MERPTADPVDADDGTPIQSELIDWQEGEEQSVELRVSRRAIALDAIEVEGRSSVLPQHQATYSGRYHRREDTRPVGRERLFVREDLEAWDGRIVWHFVRDQQVPGMIIEGIQAGRNVRVPPRVPSPGDLGRLRGDSGNRTSGR